jgi:hypothetical protein
MAVGFALFERRREPQALAIGMLWFPLITICVMTWPMQKLADVNSQRSLATLVMAADEAPQEIVLVGQRVGSLPFYLPPGKRAWYSDGRIREAEVDEIPDFLPPPPGVLFAITDKELKRQKWGDVMHKLDPKTAGAFRVIQGESDDHHVASRRESRDQ